MGAYQDLFKAIKNSYQMPLMKLVTKANKAHNVHFVQGRVQTSSLLSIKTGGCPEDCAYCPQSAHYQTGVKKEPLMEVDEVVGRAKGAIKAGATRFCMGAGWREVKDGEEFDLVLEMVRQVKALGMEVCCTLGMLTLSQAKRLKAAGLYAYNHNIDCSKDFYQQIISTRKFQDRLQTLKFVRQAGITVCTGGILGMGEGHEDRIHFIHQLAQMNPQPESVTINTLVPIEGTPLAQQKPTDALEVVRVIAVARIHMPHSMIRLSAGRRKMTMAEQFLCFFVGANSIFLGDTLLTSPNPSLSQDQKLFDELQINSGPCPIPSTA